MTILEQMLEGTKSVAILGHIRPDGDCLGSTLDFITISGLIIRIYGQPYIWKSHPLNSVI